MRTFIFFQYVYKIISIVLFTVISMSLNGQTPQKLVIKGHIVDSIGQPVAYATVTLRRVPDSIIVTGIPGDIDGNFILTAPGGQYQLIISAIGYESNYKYFNLEKDIENEIFCLREKAISLDEIIIRSERTKAESGTGKITYFISNKLGETSHNGADLLGYIPGIQVDLMKNVSMAGNGNIIIMVNGRERDRNYLGQLDASKIDRIEVSDAPGSAYDAGIAGVINIITRKDQVSGISGFINGEAPSSGRVVYLFPSYSISYASGNVNLFTSYTGELAYFDLAETITRDINLPGEINSFMSVQDVRQKNWSHRFHYGMDYEINERNIISFYSYYNPWSRELDGNSLLEVTGDNVKFTMNGRKEDTDRNSSSFYSVFYRHSPAKTGSRLDLDMSVFNQKSENISDIWYGNDGEAPLSNKSLPGQRAATLKIDYSTPFSGKLNFSGGIKIRFRNLYDNYAGDFRYSEKVYAAHASFNHNLEKLTIRSGLRIEKSILSMPKIFSSNNIALLPDLVLNYKISGKSTIKAAVNRTIIRPGLYDLNPNTFKPDPFSESTGNPLLKPEFMNSISVGYSIAQGNNFMSFQLLSRKRTGAISNYSYIKEGIFFTESGNAGNIRMKGLQTSASLRFLKNLTVNPSFNLYYFMTEGNTIAERYNIRNRNKFAFESGLSAVASFRHNFTTSLTFQYNSPDVQIQTSSYCDPLYSFSVEKTFFEKYKFGIKSIIPFSGSFTYSGSNADGQDFSYRYKGIVKMNSFPMIFSFRYQFNSGRSLNRIEHENELMNSGPKKGF